MRAIVIGSLFVLACSGGPAPASTANPDLATAVAADLAPSGDLRPAPDLATPDLATPDFAAPDFATPDFATPDFTMPHFGLPDFAAADLSSPDLASPDLATPDLGPSCSDGVKDGTETDVDCGGLCGGCAIGKMCKSGGDCASDVCCGGVCAQLQSDPTNCGACGKVCPGGGACVAGQCQGCALTTPGQFFPAPPSAPQSVTVVASGLGAPQGIVLDGAGNLYVSDTPAGAIYKIVGSSHTTWLAGLVGPADMTFDAGGDMIVADRDGNRLVKVPVSGGVAGTPSTIASIPGGPWGVTFDGQGNLYTATEFASRVDRVHLDGTVDSGVLNGLNGPLEVRFDPTGNLFVGIYGVQSGTSVNRYSPSLSLTRTFATSHGPIGLAFDRAGNLYVASYNAGTVTRFDGNGNATPFITSGLAGPHGIAFDATGALYVVNNTSGTLVKTAGTGPSSACP